MIVIICGGRDFTDRDWMFARLDAIHARAPITQVIEGGQRTYDKHRLPIGGADMLGRLWGVTRCIPVETVPANWHAFGKKAGPFRNWTMIDKKPDMVLAAPGGAGTTSMIDIAKNRGVPVLKLERVTV